MRSVLFALLMVVNTAVFGAEYSALQGKLIVGRCHMDMCWWFSLEDAQTVGSSAKGELFVIATKYWDADCKRGYAQCGKKTGGDEISIWFVFCSKQEPAFIYYEDDRWVAHMLQPGNSYAVAGVNEGEYNRYWATCHGEDVDNPYADGNKLGTRLGYPFVPNEDTHMNPPADRNLASPPPEGDYGDAPPEGDYGDAPPPEGY